MWLCLCAGAAVAVLWACRPMAVEWNWHRPDGQVRLSIAIAGGELGCFLDQWSYLDTDVVDEVEIAHEFILGDVWWIDTEESPSHGEWRKYGFGCGWDLWATPGMPGYAMSKAWYAELYTPHWFVLSLCMVFPARRYWRLRRVRSLHGGAHRCRCGYNLTGNVSGMCPECGRPVPPDDSDNGPDTGAQHVISTL